MKVLRKVKGKSRILIFVAVVALLSLALRKVRSPSLTVGPLDNDSPGCQLIPPLSPHSQLKQDTKKHREILPWHQGGYEDHHGDLDGGFVPDRGVLGAVGAMRGGGGRDVGGESTSTSKVLDDGGVRDAPGGDRNIDDISHLVDDDDEDVLGVKDEAFAGMRDSREKASR